MVVAGVVICFFILHCIAPDHHSSVLYTSRSLHAKHSLQSFIQTSFTISKMQYRLVAMLASAAAVSAAPTALLGVPGTEVVDGVLPVV